MESFIYIFIWCFTGVLSIIYWWTQEFDLTSDEIPLLVASSLLGPLSFIVGWFVFSKKGIIILIKKRK